jgi:hypothetical protein
MLERLRRTMTIVTRVQQGRACDVNGASAEACGQIIRSRQAGQVIEHRVVGAVPWLQDGRTMIFWQEEELTGFETAYRLPALAADRFILCGGSFPLPQRPLLNGRRVTDSKEHYLAFSNLVRNLDLTGAPREFHFPVDALYYRSHQSHSRTGSFNPPFEQQSIQSYFDHLTRRQTPYTLFLNDLMAFGYHDTKVRLHIWQTAGEMLRYFG